MNFWQWPRMLAGWVPSTPPRRRLVILRSTAPRQAGARERLARSTQRPNVGSVAPGSGFFLAMRPSRWPGMT